MVVEEGLMVMIMVAVQALMEGKVVVTKRRNVYREEEHRWEVAIHRPTLDPFAVYVSVLLIDQSR